MKLIDLLSCISDECEIGIVRWDDGFSISYGNKSEAMEKVAYKYRLIKEQVENMDVRNIYPGVDVQSNNVELFSRGAFPLDITPEIIIEIE